MSLEALSREFIRVCEEAAVEAARTMGQGKRKYSDHVAVEAMRKAMDRLPMRGVVVIGEGEREYSEQTAREIDVAVRRLVDRAFDVAKNILTQKRTVLESSAMELLQKETLNEEDLARVRQRMEAVTPTAVGVA